MQYGGHVRADSVSPKTKIYGLLRGEVRAENYEHLDVSPFLYLFLRCSLTGCILLICGDSSQSCSLSVSPPRNMAQANRSAQSNMGIGQPHHLFLITHPRTASNLLVRILALNDQPDVARHPPGTFGGGYFFGPAARLEIELGLREKHVEEWSEDHRKQIIERVQGCFDNLENYIQSAQTNGKIAFVKEHAVFLTEHTARRVYGRGNTHEHPWTVKVPSRYGPELTRSRLNETLFPDEYLRDWLPTFLIRHPALVFPSQYRAMRDIKLIDLERDHTFQCDVMMTFRYTRSLYDYWSVQFGKSGVDIDGDNTWVSSSQVVQCRFCSDSAAANCSRSRRRHVETGSCSKIYQTRRTGPDKVEV